MAHPQFRINLLASERVELETLIRTHSTPQVVARRARIILLANGEWQSNQVIADAMGLFKADVTVWTKRWIERALEPVAARLSDRPRPGRPDTIPPEQWCRILALAGEPPHTYGLPITHGTSTELARVALHQGIVARLSPGPLRQVLKKSRQPHRCRYGRNAKAAPRKDERIADICAVYHDSVGATASIAFAVDDMTGMQALERIAEDLAMAPSKPVAREFEYARHGTQTLIAAIQVALGRVFAHCGDTRTAADFRDFIAALIRTHPGYRTYHIVLDQLNTHKSESLVRLTAELCGLDSDLGVKGESGILKSRAS